MGAEGFEFLAKSIFDRRRKAVIAGLWDLKVLFVSTMVADGC